MADAIFAPRLTFIRPWHQYHNTHAVFLKVVHRTRPYFPQGISSYAQARKGFYRAVYARVGWFAMQYAIRRSSGSGKGALSEEEMERRERNRLVSGVSEQGLTHAAPSAEDFVREVESSRRAGKKCETRVSVFPLYHFTLRSRSRFD